MKLQASTLILTVALAPALVCATPLHGQAPAESAAVAVAAPQSMNLPAAPAALAYRYWSRQFVQWVGPELPFSMIELAIDDRGAQPLYDVALTVRATNHQVHYTNQASEVALDQAMGAEVHLVPMQFDAPPQPSNGSTYALRFLTETNVPVQWQFVQGSDLSEQGSGVTPVEGPAPSLLYRELGAVAGEGSALKVGDQTSTADLWREISHPPFFVAYHGAMSQDVQVVAFLPRTEAWKIEPAAASVIAAADWTMTGTNGRALKMHVDSLANGVATLHGTDAALGVSIALEARQTPAGWSLERVRYTPDRAQGDHSVACTFSPALGDAGTSRFELTAGRKTHLGSGSVATSAGGKEAWTLAKPNLTPKAPVEATTTQAR